MKKYIIDLDEKEMIDLIHKNEKLENKLLQDLYDNQMLSQEIQGNEMFGKDYYKWIEYHNNYQSFYLTLNDWRQFIINLDNNYLTDDIIKLVNYIDKKIEVLDSMEYGCDNYWRLDEHLENKAREVLEECEKILHEYENFPTIEEAIDYAEEMEQLNDYYININEDGSSDGVIRLDVSYTETFI